MIDEPATWNVTMRRGRTFRRVLTWKNPDGSPVNLTGYGARAQIRAKGGALIHDLAVGAGLVVGGALGTFTITLSVSQTRAILPDYADWALKVTEPGTNHEYDLFEGEITMVAEELVRD